MKTLYERVVDLFHQGDHPDDVAALEKAVPVRVDNVAQYVKESKGSYIAWEDIPNAAPPFPNFWLEFRYTDLSEKTFESGIWCMGYDTEDRDDDIGWMLACVVFQYGAGGNWSFGHRFEFQIGKNGKVVPYDQETLAYCRYQQLFPITRIEGDIDAANAAALVGLLAISFMHCKNVEVVEHGPHLRKPGTRARHAPRIKYYTLEIDPMKKVLRTEGQSETTGLKKALHICRGHFATYSDDKPLFGKYTGTFWKPMHTRGHIEQGQVVKDYAVNSPR